MADAKISQLTEKTTVGLTDYLPIVDESSTPQTKKIQAVNLVGHPYQFNVMDYGAKGDGLRITGVSCTSSSKFVTVAGAAFTQADVGKLCVIYDQNTAGNVTTIATVHSPTTIDLTAIAGVTRDDNTTYFAYGTDDHTAFAACFTAASTNVTTDPTTAPNIPVGSGQPLVIAPAKNNPGFYFLGSALTIPTAMIFDCQGMLFNAISDRFAPFILISQYCVIRKLWAECAFGSGIVAGTTDDQEGDIHFGDIALWNVGTDISGGNVYQTGVELIGYLFSIERLFIKGGTYGLWCNSGSDITAKHVFAIGSVTGIYLANTNQANFSNVFLDTIKTNGFYDGAVILDHACSDVYMKIQAYEFEILDDTASPVVSIGKLNNILNTYITLDIMANNTGGTIVDMDYLQDAKITILGSNEVLPLGATNPIQTGVVFGTNCSGQIEINATYTAGITPSSGTVVGDYSYTQGGRFYTGNASIAGSGKNLGFYGVTPISRATLATGASHTVDDVITALQNLGLVKQS